jgi:hypothetical protein
MSDSKKSKDSLTREDLSLSSTQLNTVSAISSTIATKLNGIRVVDNEEFCSDAIENALGSANVFSEAAETIRIVASLKKHELFDCIAVKVENAKKLEALASRNIRSVKQSQSLSPASSPAASPKIEQSWSTVVGRNRQSLKSLVESNGSQSSQNNGHSQSPKDTKKSSLSAIPPALVGSMLIQAQRRDLAPQTMVEAAPGVSLEAIPIERADQCHLHLGQLCYVASQKQFVVSLNGFVIPIATARIIEPDEHPVKTEEFDPERGRKSPQKADNFYHPPEFGGKPDRRNFIKTLSYVAGSEQPPDNFQSLRLGDRNKLADDLVAISDQDARMFVDYNAMHLACTIALLQHKKVNTL